MNQEEPKYTLEEEGGMYRLIAARNFQAYGCLVKAGEHGGLIGNDGVLSHNGNAWVGAGATVDSNSRIYGDAYIGNGSEVRDSSIYGDARIVRSTIIGSSFLNGYAVDSTVEHSYVQYCQVSESQIHNTDITKVGVHGCDMRNAVGLYGMDCMGLHIDERGVLAVSTRWGFLVAGRCRNDTDTWKFSVGCQTAYSLAGLKQIADYFDASETELKMLAAYGPLVEAFQQQFISPEADTQDLPITQEEVAA